MAPPLPHHQGPKANLVTPWASPRQTPRWQQQKEPEARKYQKEAVINTLDNSLAPCRPKNAATVMIPLRQKYLQRRPLSVKTETSRKDQHVVLAARGGQRPESRTHAGDKGPEAQVPHEGAHHDKARRAWVQRGAKKPMSRRVNKARRANPALPRKTQRARGLNTLRVCLCRQHVQIIRQDLRGEPDRLGR